MSGPPCTARLPCSSPSRPSRRTWTGPLTCSLSRRWRRCGRSRSASPPAPRAPRGRGLRVGWSPDERRSRAFRRRPTWASNRRVDSLSVDRVTNPRADLEPQVRGPSGARTAGRRRLSPAALWRCRKSRGRRGRSRAAGSCVRRCAGWPRCRRCRGSCRRRRRSGRTAPPSVAGPGHRRAGRRGCRRGRTRLAW